ncbi:MAG: hypothetical protein HOI23_19605 [Deltaproteobacteria bacterium]|nr:hypothetical protein [Deltaproteobacteria bacterium]MBT6436147.1 hypothetical protein [Deltaproteobacteria bacterium]
MPRFAMLTPVYAIVLMSLGLFGCSQPEVLMGIPESLDASAWNGTMQDAYESPQLVEINLGDVNAGATFTAWFKLKNDGQSPIEVHSIQYNLENQSGDRWELMQWLPGGEWNNRTGLTLPLTLAPDQDLILGIPFTAIQEGGAQTDIRVNAGFQTEKLLRVSANAVSAGQPDISVSFGDLPGTTIETSCVQGVCSTPDNTPLVVGSFEANTPVSVAMHIRNMAQCPVLTGNTSCTTCALRVESNDGSRGISLSNGSLTDGSFNITANDASIMVPQADTSCDDNGVYSFTMNVAPSEAGTYSTSLFIDSNDPDEARIEIPLMVRFTDVIVPGMDPDIEVRAGSVSGPIVATECANGNCMLNGGLAIDLGNMAPNEELSIDVGIENLVDCPSEVSCDDCALDITGLSVTAADQGADWEAVIPFSSNTLHPNRPDCTLPSSKTLSVQVSATQPGNYNASLHVTSNDPDETQIEIPLTMAVVEQGQPEIEVEFEGMVGPIVGTDCSSGICRLGSQAAPIYLGHILPGANQTTQLYIRNKSECDSSCNSCSLNLSNGVTFANGQTSQSSFSMANSASSALSIAPANPSCGENGIWSTAVQFAPGADGNYAAKLVVDSNDSDEARIEIFIAASAGPEPVAIASSGPCTSAVGYQATCNNDENIDPMESVRLDGSQSFDPSGLDLSRYIWTVELAPTGSQRTSGEVLDTCYTAWESNCEIYEGMLADLPGQYRVCLTVENEEGVQSLDTAASCTTFNVLPSSHLHVQLTWSELDDADQDLHLVYVENDPRVCNQQSDCHWRNCKPDAAYDAPQWFNQDGSGEGANPRLDVDSTSGTKHENINIDSPRAGTYAVYVHYYEWTDRIEGPSEVNVTIWLGGVEVFSSSRILSSSNAIWRVGDITWNQNGSLSGAGNFQTFDPYNIGSVGSVEYEAGLSAGSNASTYYCSSIQGGWEFPE